MREQDLEEDSVIANKDRTKYCAPNINRKDSARRACANLLLQAGADILTTDKNRHMADPGVDWACNETRIWWCEFVAKETSNIKMT